MRVSAAHSPGGPFQIIGSLWAGVASAAICYAEYLGLGAVLGPALMGFGSQNKSVGTLLVVTSAVIACLVYAASKLSYLAGPRGASLSMLVMALIGLQKAFAPPAEQQVGVLACVMLGAAIMLALSANQHVQKEFKRLPAWLMPSFIYASAISIIVGATAKHLLGCLQREALQTMLIFVSATLLGIGWPYACNWLVKQLGERGYERLASNMSKLRGIALLLAGGLAWLGYEWSALSQPMGGLCARLGRVDLDVHVFTSRMGQLLHPGSVASMWHVWLWALVCGVIVGAVAAIESKSTLDVLEAEVQSNNESETSARTSASAALRINAGIALLMVPATSVISSVSLSRTQVLKSFHSPNVLAVLVHALSLACIALFASHWLAGLPQVALAVLMTLVATQMLTKSTIEIWTHAYDPEVAPVSGIVAGLGFWLVVLISVFLNQPLFGLLVPAAFYYLLRFKNRHRKRATHSDA